MFEGSSISVNKTLQDGTVLLFNSGIDHEEALLNNIGSIPVMGGRASKIGQASFVLFDRQILYTAITGVQIIGDHIDATIITEACWKPAGRTFEVTKSLGNRLFEIEGMSPFHFYERYLGARSSK